MPRIPDNEFSNDLGYMPSMDSAWHYWMAEKYNHNRESCEENFLKTGKYSTNKIQDHNEVLPVFVSPL